MSLLTDLPLAPRDPIIGLTEAFVADPRETKVNLGVGVYTDENGRVPLLRCVEQADERVVDGTRPWSYLPIDGLPAYRSAVAGLVFGDELAHERVAVVQGVGGTGGLKIAADLVHQTTPDARVLISDPSWENHRAIFTRAGLTVDSYPYYDAQTRSVDVDGMLDALRTAEAGTVVVLHACCHNPTGYDLTPQQWEQVRDVVVERGLVPLLDMAYQGFAHGIEEDGAAVRLFARTGVAMLVATSFSKSFSLYGERVGALSVVCSDADEAARVQSQLKVIIRTTYSNPPSHGALVVSTVLGDAELRQTWEDELGSMRERIRAMRTRLRDGLAAAIPGADVEHFVVQNGMFSYTGLSAEQMRALREEHGVYGLDSGRICVAALDERNLPTVIEAVAAVW
ncbi:aminotransferase class I/II-fold pyridoxal phosphate-dependent enzyme [Janibacter melonis]|uniref:Aminotransferase n=2 Tax=Janibacter melonis TaxID=262209 RepID=A0A5P8FJV5_9MICO|nr:amino acid aminotransferase [Janibacter melonis]QFQ29132.1 aminotransferase class I/II-fold pyridoxal phosphate-dependent enzyme [Janibacter melonis]